MLSVANRIVRESVGTVWDNGPSRIDPPGLAAWGFPGNWLTTLFLADTFSSVKNSP